jgi:hypothetical protein
LLRATRGAAADFNALERRLARGRRRVEPLLMPEQIDALVMKVLQDAEQIRQRSA